MNPMNILTLTGPSCSGKTTLLNFLVGEHGYRKIISHTTRPPRKDEIQGKDYHFVTDEDFENLKSESKFAETVQFGDFQYGISIDELVNRESEGLPVIICEPTGLINLHEYISNNLPEVKLNTVYIGGSKALLLARYIRRIAYEGDLYKDTVSTYHSKRIISLIDEIRNWAPSEINVGNIPWSQLSPGLIPYDLVLDGFNMDNLDECINQVKALNEA